MEADSEGVPTAGWLPANGVFEIVWRVERTSTKRFYGSRKRISTWMSSSNGTPSP